MKYKVIDAAWIADKSLDLYCSRNMDRFHGGVCTLPEVGKIFENVFVDDVVGLTGKYDKVFVIAPCFPIMRVRNPIPMMDRFICRNSSYLREHGVSTQQFLKFFEKFIQLKWKNGDLTIENEVYLLKSKRALLKDWVDALVEKFGLSLLDMDKTDGFNSNPQFISTMEADLGIYEEIDQMERFKIRNLVEKCMSN